MKRCLYRLLPLWLWACLCLALLWPTQALAHANLLHAIPQAGAVVTPAPSQLTLHFSEPLEPDLIDVTLYNNRGEQVPLNDLRLQPGNAEMLIAALPPLADGTYSVVWKIVSEDGHPVEEVYQFSVGHATSFVPPRTDKAAQTSDLFHTLLTGARSLMETLLLLGAGLAILAARVAPHGFPSLPQMLGTHRRWLWALLLLGTVAEWLLYTWNLPGADLNAALLSGHWHTLGESAFAVILLIQCALLLLMALPKMTTAWYLTLWVLLTANLAFGGHAWGVEPLAMSVTARVVHLLGIALWLGSLSYLVLLLVKQRGTRSLGAVDRVQFRSLFLQTVTGASVLTILSGVVMTSIQTGWSAIFQDLMLWDVLLLGKLALVLVMVALAIWQTRRWRADVHQLAPRPLQLEWLVGLVVLLLGVWLSQLPYH